MVYSVYALIQDLRQKCKESLVKDEDEKDKDTFDMEMKEFNKTMKLNNSSLIGQKPLLSYRKGDITTEGYQDMNEGDSPGRLQPEIQKKIKE